MQDNRKRDDKIFRRESADATSLFPDNFQIAWVSEELLRTISPQKYHNIIIWYITYRP